MPSPVQVLSSTGGSLLAGGTRLLGAALRRTKPLHPEGHLRRATVTRTGADPATGCAWLDEPGTDDALVRVSRGIGLPGTVPDVHGMAIRVSLDGAVGDLLLASTGTGRLSRFLLTATRSAGGGPLGTLLPYRSPRGPVLIAAVPESPLAFRLQRSGLAGDWVPFGRLELGEDLGDDTQVSFDPVVNVLPGLATYDWVRRLRGPAYRTARRRSDRPDPVATATAAAPPQRRA